jgi:8-oxo-dGTP pyrophosphatase MutT (NUDIX family)
MTDFDLIDYQDPIVALRKYHPTSSCIVRDDCVSSSARNRIACFRWGSHMIANDLQSIADAFYRVSKHISEMSSDGLSFECPLCKVAGDRATWDHPGRPMSLSSLKSHLVMYHGARHDPAMEPRSCMVPDCRSRSSQWETRSFTVHTYFHGTRAPKKGDLEGFAHVICRRPQDERLLLVHESAGLCSSESAGACVTKYWWPAGRLDPGENFERAAVRETEEEGGVKIHVFGVLEIHISASRKRVHVIVLAEPVPTEGEDEMAACKSVPDFESVGTMWVDVSELVHLEEEDFRDSDPLDMFPLVSNGVIRARSIETQAFRQLEELMTTWTVKKGEYERDLESVVNSLRRKYGPDVVLEDLYSLTRRMRNSLIW